MKTTFDFIPRFCPFCGAKLFHPAGAEALEVLRGTLDDYHNGQPFTCDCGLQFQKAQGEPSITIPVGVGAGNSHPAVKVLNLFASEMLGHGADLEESAARQQDKADAFWYGRQAELLRRYGWAAWIIWLQMDPSPQANPALGSLQLEEIAKEYKLALPKQGEQFKKTVAAHTSAHPHNHCAFCGGLLELDEGHKSKIHEGLVCDGCYELERKVDL